ncbi:hypothetical protein [Pseudoalteromonas sp. Of7M-16]|uniref:hypothetical protein n=1 Tax=Pseudoalteromonas sp. Of7M-16 TaxID=2917756 RepID=UPI001EF6BB65|nr:hypothetical protein [Pseudoalteromonas sp. Of7M-16]MCG7551342.1 hypothetical protein [Pseudoalteromonas sp. Of7M-16]
MTTFHHVTEGEFVRLLQTHTLHKFIAQESAQFKGKYHLVGIAPAARTAYAIRQGRINELRKWRLDNLGGFLSKHGVRTFEVQNNL